MIRLIDRLKNEPVLLITAAIIALTALQSAMTAGLEPTDAALAVAQALLGFLARSLVYAPETVQKVADRAAETGNTDIGSPPAGDLAP